MLLLTMSSKEIRRCHDDDSQRYCRSRYGCLPYPYREIVANRTLHTAGRAQQQAPPARASHSVHGGCAALYCPHHMRGGNRGFSSASKD